jgi:predicted amidohydrolase
MPMCSLVPTSSNGHAIEVRSSIAPGSDLGDRLEVAGPTLVVRVVPLTHELTVTEHGPLLEVGVADRTAAMAAARRVMREAQRQDVDVLVLTELSLGPGVLERLRRELGGSKPLLVVGGLAHHRYADSTGGELHWRNSAVVVGPNGDVIHRHHKLTRVNFAERQQWEIHETGRTLTLFPSAIGLVTTVICKDLFTEVCVNAMSDAGVTLLLVPSLSPHVGEHRVGAETLRSRNLTSTFVANRWGLLGGEMLPERGASFAIVPGRSGSDGTEFELDVRGVTVRVQTY